MAAELDSPAAQALIDQRVSKGLEPLWRSVNAVRDEVHGLREDMAGSKPVLEQLQITAAALNDQIGAVVTTETLRFATEAQAQLYEAKLSILDQKLAQRPTRKELVSYSLGAAGAASAIVTAIHALI